jgi:hypothetical protein
MPRTCVRCGYDLRGHSSVVATCPECGYISSAAGREPNERRWLVHVAVIAWPWLALGCVLGVYSAMERADIARVGHPTDRVEALDGLVISLGFFALAWMVIAIPILHGIVWRQRKYQRGPSYAAVWLSPFLCVALASVPSYVAWLISLL